MIPMVAWHMGKQDGWEHVRRLQVGIQNADDGVKKRQPFSNEECPYQRASKYPVDNNAQTIPCLDLRICKALPDVVEGQESNHCQDGKGKKPQKYACWLRLSPDPCMVQVFSVV